MLSAAVLLGAWVWEDEKFKCMRDNFAAQLHPLVTIKWPFFPQVWCRHETQAQDPAPEACLLPFSPWAQAECANFYAHFCFCFAFCLIVPAFPRYWPHFQILLHTWRDCQAHAQNVPSEDTPLRTACSGGEQSERRIISSVLGTEAGKMVIVTSCEGLGMQTFSWS